jgi:hypothetical protein
MKKSDCPIVESIIPTGRSMKSDELLLVSDGGKSAGLIGRVSCSDGEDQLF